MCSTESDPWLTAWMPRLRSLSLEEPVLELGCGKGRDTTTLCAGGLAVVATDISRASLQQCAKGARRASAVQMDLREPFPFRAMSFRVIVASLSLHDVVGLLAGWRIERLAEKTIQRYEKPKVVWEVVALGGA
jgi:SAM-dependent methyltransferase